MDDFQLVTEKEAAARLGYSTAWLQRQRWRSREFGELHGPPFVKLPSGGVRYRLSDLEAWAWSGEHSLGLSHQGDG